MTTDQWIKKKKARKKWTQAGEEEPLRLYAKEQKL